MIHLLLILAAPWPCWPSVRTSWTARRALTAVADIAISWVRNRRAARAAENERVMALPALLAAVVPYEVHAWPEPMSPRLHERATPAALPLRPPAPATLAEGHRRAIDSPPPREQVKILAPALSLAGPVRTEVDDGCSVPCTARHCAEHSAENRRLAHLAWTTPTAEWNVSLLGLGWDPTVFLAGTPT
jgi:hypothetical protein